MARRDLGLGVVALLGGVLTLGAADPPLPVTPDPAGALAKLLPTPRLYELTMTRDGKTDPATLMCMGADPIVKMLEGLRASLAKKPVADAAKELSKGCTHNLTRAADGSAHMEMACDKAAGAATTSRMTMDVDGQFKSMRQRMELEMDLGGGPPRTVAAETRMAQAGDCPADLKPGQMRTADGRTVDVMGMFAALSGAVGSKPDAPKGPPP